MGQSAHFPGKQFTLHWAIVEQAKFWYRHHISDDTKHDSISVNYFVRDITERRGIKNEDLWIQSGNALSHALAFYQNQPMILVCVSYERTELQVMGKELSMGCWAPESKGLLMRCQSFRVTNILRHDIFTQDIFKDSESIVNYLAQKKPEFSYTHVSALEVTAKRCEEAKSFEIENCMRQHIMVFETGRNVILKECLYECDPCQRFEFGKCENKNSEANPRKDNEEYLDD